MIAVLGWLWAWWCDPAEMMRQRRQLQHWKREVKAQRMLLREEARGRRFATSMTRVQGTNEWWLVCTCGWSRRAYYDSANAAKVRAICDEHDNEH